MTARLAGWLVVIACSLGCGGPTLEARVTTPATVPLRTFPSVLVATADELDAIALGDRLARHLAAGGIEARRVRTLDLEAMRTSGRIGRAVGVVILEARVRETNAIRYDERPETVCGPSGCFTRQRRSAYDVPVLEVRLRVSVHEGATGRALQRVSFGVEEEGRTYDRMRERAFSRIGDRLVRLVDTREERVRVALPRLPLPEVEAAVEELRGGRWREGRAALERLARDEAVTALEPEKRARVYFVLSVARRFDPVSLERDVERHFRAAESALRAALRDDPHPRYQRALEALIEHRRQVELLRAQREAAEHNFGLDATPADPGVPTPPPGYGAPESSVPGGPQTGSDVPASDTPASDAPASDTPASDTPASDTPASDTPASEAPAPSDALAPAR
ncbi:MAG: hypothetical protein H6721_24640 [Sandaracinus sp.]|nr:hypothetical protein [Sandaracinus sp.]MCB9618982.1 hypothetical protein [Sandaracinus sp.]MCB9623628.1 hypothetical protein [Sandaracinus sp.]MCB9635321.1 hypothetical protein [Sandaracinus sp.]